MTSLIETKIIQTAKIMLDFSFGMNFMEKIFKISKKLFFLNSGHAILKSRPNFAFMNKFIKVAISFGVFCCSSMVTSAYASNLYGTPNPSTTGSFTLTWSASTSNCVNCLVYENGQVISATSSGSKIINKTVNGNYNYELWEQDPYGNPLHKTVTTTVVVNIPLATVGAVNAQINATNNVALSWVAVPNATRYEVQVKKNQVLGAISSVTTAGTTMPVLTESGTYSYLVKACNTTCTTATESNSVVFTVRNESPGAGYKLVGNAPLISPTTYFASFSEAVTAEPFLKRLDNLEIDELAEQIQRLSGVDPADYSYGAYQYVVSEISPEFRFGLSKGGLGALIDHSGTPFDQAQLLKLLLSSKGVSASYVVGTAQLTSSQFSNWTGINSAREACLLFANGGIPAVINGVASIDCNNASYDGTLSSVNFVHVWVKAQINGQFIDLDPSIKTMTYNTNKLPQTDLKSLIGYSSSFLITNVDNAKTDIDPGVQERVNSKWYSVDSVKIPTILDDLATTYLSSIQAVYDADTTKSLRTIDILGGKEITNKIRKERPTSLSYSATPQKQLTEIPDSLRIKLIFSGFGIAYADQTYGRHISFEKGCKFYFDGKPQSSNDISTLTLSIDFPYPANNASYMDFSNSFSLDCVSQKTATLIQGFGASSDGLAKAFADTTVDTRLTLQGTSANGPVQYTDFNTDRLVSGRKAYNFLSENSQWVDFVSGLTRSHIELHGVIGIAKTIKLQAALGGGSVSNPLNVPITQETTTLDVATRASFAKRIPSSDLTSVNVGRTLAWISSGLEGGISKRLSGADDSVSTSSRFNWAVNRNIPFAVFYPNATIQSSQYPPNMISGLQQIKNDLAAQNKVLDDFMSSELDNYSSSVLAPIGKYFVANGYSLTWPRAAVLGPGDPIEQIFLNNYGSDPNGTPLTRWEWFLGMGIQLGGAMYAEKPEEGIYYPLVFTGNNASKGGGAPELVGKTLVAPKADGRQKFDIGVEKVSGEINYTIPEIMSLGSADNVLGLSVGVSLTSRKEEPEYRYAGFNSPTGALRNTPRFKVTGLGEANLSSDGKTLFGKRTALEAAPAVVAVLSMLDNSAGTTRSHSPAINALMVKWLEKQADNNSIQVTSANGSQTFVRRLAKNTNSYFPDPASPEKATVNLVENVYWPTSSDSCSGVWSTPLSTDINNVYAVNERKFITLDLTRTLKNSDKEIYSTKKVNTGRCTTAANDSNWYPLVKLTSLAGPEISYTYNESAKNKDLTSIKNSVGREITFVKTFTEDKFKLEIKAGTRKAVVEETSTGVDVTLPDFKKWHAEYDLAQDGSATKKPLAGWVLKAVYAPSSLTNPVIRYSTDQLWRASSVDLQNNVGANYWLNAYRWFHLPGYATGEIDYVGSKTIDYTDSNGDVDLKFDAAGTQTFNIYDALHRLVDKRIVPKDRVASEYLTRTTYKDFDIRSNPTIETLWPKAGSTKSALITNRTYDDLTGNLKTESFRHAEGAAEITAVTNTYNSTNGLIIQSFTAAGLLTKYETYNSLGLPTLITEGSSSTVIRRKVLEYDDGNNTLGNLTKFTTTDVASNTNTAVIVSATYSDPIRGDISSVTDPRGNLTSASYDDARHLTDITAPLGTGAKYDYDNNGRLYQIQTKDGKGNFAVTTATLNPLGWMTGLKDPSNNWQYFNYDARGLLNQSWDGMGRITQYRYDANGNKTCEQNAYGTALVRSYRILGYNELGQLVSSNPAKSDTNNDCVINNTTYQTSFTYDDYAQPSTTIFPDSTYEQSSYNPNGNGTVTTKRTRKGETIGLTYDGANRLYTKTVPNNGTITYNYNVFSLPITTTQVGGANSTLGFGYDFLGRLTSSTQNGRTVTMDYDKSNNRSFVQWPEGYKITYGAYDSLNRITTITDSFGKQLANYSYDINYDPNAVNGSRTTLTYGNGKTSYFDYKPDGDLKTLTHNTGAPVIYGYGYNAAHQLASESLSNRSYHWNPNTAGSSYSANRLDQYSGVDTGAGAVTFTYDDNGNLTTGNKGTFNYDAENKLTSAAINASGPQGALNVNYSYDPNGRRTQKSVTQNGSTTSTQYLSEGDNEIAEYVGTATTPSKRFIYGKSIDEIIAMQDVASNTYSYAHRDHQGSVVAVSDAAGNVSGNNIYTYSAYGEPNTAANTGSAGFPYRYTGRRIDTETGFYYYRARYYDPQLGRFLQVDPIGYKDQMNLYAYVGSDPVNKTDPSGMSEESRRGRAMRTLVKAFVKPKGAIARSLKNAEATEKAETAMLAGDKKAAAEAIKEVGSKRGPKTDGEGPHNEKIKEVGDRAIANGDKVVAGGGKEPEKLIETPGGNKNGRRPDVIIEDGKTGELRGVNIGRVKADGTPIKREQEALDDLNNFSDIPTTFEAYLKIK